MTDNDRVKVVECLCKDNMGNPLISALDEADAVYGLARDCEVAVPLSNSTSQSRLYWLLKNLHAHADKLRGLKGA